MASSVRIPAGSLFSIARPEHSLPRLIPSRPSFTVNAAASCQCRPFSSAQLMAASPRARGVPTKLAMPQMSQPSMRTRSKGLTRHQMPQDLGLLPGTFIRPLWRDLPSIFQQPRERLQFEWLWVKSTFQNLAGLAHYSKSKSRGLPFRLKERRQVGQDLHVLMYEAFAKGDVYGLRNVCCTGLANDLTARINRRPKNERVTWHLEKYNRTPATLLTGIRVMSDRATDLPGIDDSGVRQVVLRIASRQSTSKTAIPENENASGGGESTPASTPPTVKDCTEHIVIQKLRWFGREEDWRVWGQVAPTSIEQLDDPLFSPGLSVTERVMAMKEQFETR